MKHSTNSSAVGRTGDAEIDEAQLVRQLRARRVRLLTAYVFHVCWLTSTAAVAATDAVELALVTTLWITLITVPPVLIYSVSVHRACRAIDPHARSVGVMPIVFATVFLTPFESALILPARNLLISRRILERLDRDAIGKGKSGDSSREPPDTG